MKNATFLLFFVGFALTLVGATNPVEDGNTAEWTESSDPRAVKIDSVYGVRTVFVGQEENYRVRVKAGAYWPITYEWDLGDGTKTYGNNVVQGFKYPGRYKLAVDVSNAYGKDHAEIWIRVLEKRAIVARDKDKTSKQSVAGVDLGDAPKDVTVISGEAQGDGTYYSWIAETHLNRLGADNAARVYAQMKLDQVRVFVDAFGEGSDAYRILIGKYASQQRALRQKMNIEAILGRPVSLMRIRS